MQELVITSLIVAHSLAFTAGATSNLSTTAPYGSNGTISGQTVVDLGNQSDQPVLRLIGTLIMNLEKEVHSQKNIYLLELICRLHYCTEWGEWSECSASNSGEFGVRNRTRLCGFNTSYCRRLSVSEVKYETDVCQNPCRPHNCTEWGVWSRCNAIDRNALGNSTRSRRCDFPSTLCEQYLESKDEFESKVCENICPNAYTTTTHGYCFKIFALVYTRDAAEATCRKDGGHLANVDSELAMQDLNNFILKSYGNKGFYWIDGHRSVQAGSWEYGYTPENSNFTIWGDNEPTNGPYDLCRRYQWMNYNGTKAWRMRDLSCKITAWFLCQIIS
ncbi:uncharacterized protein LOC128550704 [Mercenaria mercenaria]|uniref:uncharacterized protein LOC128550704 n=1 Tax=Mercenaria mercenaria TaxID=6596 RepID=UPI00234E82EB|nr:uncharacterized protein LOC128550704 [Mercenaria mercenaria]